MPKTAPNALYTLVLYKVIVAQFVRCHSFI